MEKEVRLSALIIFILAIVFLLGAFFQLKFPATGFSVFDASESVSNDTVYLSAMINETIDGNETIGVKNVSLLINGEVNQTDISGDEREYNWTLTLEEGNYNWSVLVYYENNQSETSEERSFTVESTAEEEPEEEFTITIISPEAKIYETENIELSVSANENVSSWRYVLNEGNETEFTPNTTNTTLQNLSDGDYSLIVYANNTEEEINQSVSFSVLIPSCSNDVSLCDETSCTGAGGYWYDAQCNAEEEPAPEEPEENESSGEAEETTGEGSESEIIPLSITKLDISTISDLKISPSNSEQILLTARNTGTEPLSSCKIQTSGDIANWTSYSEDSINLNAGDEENFLITLEVPENTSSEIYGLEVSVRCSQTTQSAQISVNVVEKSVDFELTGLRETGDNVRAIYTLEELSGTDQEVELSFTLLDNQSQEISDISDSKNLTANSTQRFDALIPVNQSLIQDEINILVDLVSGDYVFSTEESMTLSSAPFLGFTIFDENGLRTGSIVVLVVAILALVSIILLVRRFRKTKRQPQTQK